MSARWTMLALVAGCEVLGGAPANGELTVESFGELPIDGDGFVEVDVNVPAGAVSTLAWCGGFGDDALGTVWSVLDPTGAEVYNGYAPDGAPFRSDYLDDLVPALLPTTPALPPTEGAWHFQFYVEGAGASSTSCGAVHRVDTLSDPARVYVEFVYVSVPGIAADVLPADPNWQAALAELESAWASGGLAPSYSYTTFTGDLDTYAVVDIVGDDYSEFNDLLRTTNPLGSRTLTVFLVEEIAADGATILGLAGGPPGGATLPGTSKSGMIVTTADLATSPADVGKIIAHEGGHFLGLYHTTEKDGSRSDPLGDTPEGEAGSDNVMWWTLTDGTGTMTSDQSFVVRSNPVAD